MNDIKTDKEPWASHIYFIHQSSANNMAKTYTRYLNTYCTTIRLNGNWHVTDRYDVRYHNKKSN